MTVTKFEEHGDRYKYDWRCRPAEGWAQVDTHDDAWYFGQWLSVRQMRAIQYMEGDVIITRFDELGELIAWVRQEDAWRGEGAERFRNGHTIGIDTMLDARTEAEFRAAGLGEYLH